MTVDTTADQSAEALLHALQWIHHFSTQTVVVGLTAGSFNDEQRRKELLTDVYFLASIGARPVIMHGGADANDTGQNSEQKIAVELNGQLADEYEAIGGRAMTLNFESGAVLQGELTDAGTTGAIQSVDRIVIDNLCYAGQTPVIPAMCEVTPNQRLLVDDFAAIPFVASSLAAKAAVIVMPELTSNQKSVAVGDIESFAQQSGISTDISSAIVNAIESGLESVHLIDSSIPHGLLRQLFTADRPGVEIKKVI